MAADGATGRRLMAPRKRFLLRVDPELWKELDKWAAAELRMNAQVEWVLRDAVKKRKGGRRGG